MHIRIEVEQNGRPETRFQSCGHFRIYEVSSPDRQWLLGRGLARPSRSGC